MVKTIRRRLRRIFKSRRNIGDRNDNLTIDDAEYIAASAYSLVEKFGGKCEANAGHQCQNDGQRSQLWPVRFDWILRRRRLFDDLKLLGLLILLKIFTEPCRSQFGRSASPDYFCRDFLLRQKRLQITGHCRGLSVIRACGRRQVGLFHCLDLTLQRLDLRMSVRIQRAFLHKFGLKLIQHRGLVSFFQTKEIYLVIP